MSTTSASDIALEAGLDPDNDYRCCPSHCCVRHGCKYGHWGGCPVVTGKDPGVRCEACDDADVEAISRLEAVIATVRSTMSIAAPSEAPADYDNHEAVVWSLGYLGGQADLVFNLERRLGQLKAALPSYLEGGLCGR